MDEIKPNCVSKPSRPYARYIATAVPVLLLITLILFFISHQERPSMFEDLDRWCDRYHPELSYSACYDKAGLESK